MARILAQKARHFSSELTFVILRTALTDKKTQDYTVNQPHKTLTFMLAGPAFSGTIGKTLRRPGSAPDYRR